MLVLVLGVVSDSVFGRGVCKPHDSVFAGDAIGIMHVVVGDEVGCFGHAPEWRIWSDKGIGGRVESEFGVRST